MSISGPLSSRKRHAKRQIIEFEVESTSFRCRTLAVGCGLVAGAWRTDRPGFVICGPQVVPAWRPRSLILLDDGLRAGGQRRRLPVIL